MKKTAKLFIMLSFLCVIAFALPLTAQAEEPVYDLELSEVVLYLPSQSDLVVKNLVNDKINIAFDVTNNGTERYGYIMCAYYSPDGQFLGQECKTNQADPNITKTFRHDFLIDNSEGEVGSVKIFAFDSFDNMKPIAEPVEIHTAAGEHPVLWMGKQETVNGYTRVYVMGDEYYGWYILDENVNREPLEYIGVKNITVENGKIISLTEEMTINEIVWVDEINESGFTDIMGNTYTYSPEGCRIFCEDDGVLYPGETRFGVKDGVLFAQDNGYVTDIFIPWTGASVPLPEPVEGDVLYYPGISDVTGAGTMITYYLNGEEKQSLVAKGLELPEAGAYTFTIEGDEITSMTAAGIKGDIEAKSSRYVKMYSEKYYFSDDMVIYDVSDGVSKVETFTILDEIIVITNIDNEASIIFIVEPYVYEPSDPVVPEPEPITDMIIYYTGNHEEGAEGTEIEYYAEGTAETAYLAEGLEVPAETGAYKAVFDSEEKITSFEKIGEYGKVTMVKASYFKTTDSTYVLADKVDVYNVTDGIDADEILAEDEVIVVLNDDGEVYLIFIVG